VWKIVKIKCEKNILSSINKWVYTQKKGGGGLIFLNQALSLKSLIPDWLKKQNKKHTKHLLSIFFPKTPYQPQPLISLIP